MVARCPSPGASLQRRRHPHVAPTRTAPVPPIALPLALVCNDIGMVQIPNMVAAQCDGVTIDHAFGREFPALDKGLGSYDLIVHCGACMIDHQKMRARLCDAQEAGVPITNYGLVMSYAYNGHDALRRVLEPWEVSAAPAG